VEFNEECDAYASVCRYLPKLCPRLVPKPLWGLSLAKLARLSPLTATAICDGCDDVVKGLKSFWKRLERRVCSVCGSSASHIDEDWRYYVYGAGNKVLCNNDLDSERIARGVAYLRALKPLCLRCHMAKHQGFARVSSKSVEALTWLATVNGVSIDVAKSLVEKAFNIWNRLSRISSWSIAVGDIGLEEELKRKVEAMLNTMLSQGFSIGGRVLRYESPTLKKVILARAAAETVTLLNDVSSLAGTRDVTSEAWRQALLITVKEFFRDTGIDVLDEEFMYYMDSLIEKEEVRRVLERMATLATTVVRDSGELASILTGFEELEGAWIINVNPQKMSAVLRNVIDELEAQSHAYVVEAPTEPEKEESFIAVYVPSALALRLVAEVAYILWGVLVDHDIGVEIFFRPTSLAENELEGNLKPYIYVFSLK
jgi:hypothetical protein